jgi:SAM-dependent methyltransferase
MVMKSTQDRICRDVADPLNGARLCQQGLQFFPDKAVALREMHRVLAGNDLLALSVWNNVGIYNTAVSAALTRFVGSDVAARFNASRKTPTADELRRLVTEARFSDVEVSVSRINVHLPRIDRFVVDHLAATPVATAVEAIDAEARKQVGASVVEQLLSYADGDGITYPEETYVLTAQVR